MFKGIPEKSGAVVFLGDQTSGWKNLAAWDPIDSISLSLNDSSSELVHFVNTHSGKFMAGYITYEFGVKELDIPIHERDENMPAVHFRAYTDYVEIDCKPLNNYSSWDTFKPVISKEKYNVDFEQIISCIKAGEFYQINYTQPFTSKTDLLPRNLFQSLRKRNKVGFSAYIESSEWSVHCFSPEQFIKIQKGVIWAQPIKGTTPRGKTPESDEKNLQNLLTSEKEQAELYMIIDLLRNDLGKVCEFGSVQVMESKSILKLEKVFHTYGLIQGRMKKNIQPIEALLSMVPAGSISGCPKKRSCEAIYEFEDYPRSVYTGTIGYILPDNMLHFNVAIRTVIQKGNILTLGVGGGITIDSKNEEEFNESLNKAASFQP